MDAMRLQRGAFSPEDIFHLYFLQWLSRGNKKIFLFSPGQIYSSHKVILTSPEGDGGNYLLLSGYKPKRPTNYSSRNQIDIVKLSKLCLTGASYLSLSSGAGKSTFPVNSPLDFFWVRPQLPHLQRSPCMKQTNNA